MSFSFYFADAGGCFFMEAGGSSGHLTMGGMKWLMAIPIGLKLIAPSWLFILSSIRIRGQSIKACFFGVCKATVHTGQFHISGPITPVLMILEEIAAPKTCELIETLPDISFTMSGSTFTMSHQQYVIESEAYGEKECLVAFTPVFQLIPGFGMWIFGDAWVHAFYTKFEVIPLKRVGMAISDGRYFEKNACTGNGIGPMGTTKPMKREKEDNDKALARQSFDYGMEDQAKTIGWKRFDNWMRDLSDMKKGAPAEGILKQPCPSNFRFKEGTCIANTHVDQVKAARDWQQNLEEEVPRSLSMQLFNEKFTSDGTSTSERFFNDHGGDGFMSSFLEKDEDLLLKKAFRRDIKPDRESMKEFRKRTQDKLKEEAKREEARLRDRVEQGFEPDYNRFKSGAKIHLYDGDLHESDPRFKALMRNTSLVLRMMEKELNVTSTQTKTWWRGESEDWIDDERLRLIGDYERQLSKARNIAKSFKVKSALNKKILRRVAERMTITNEQVEQALREEEKRSSVDGPWNAWDENPYHNKSADLFLKAERMFNTRRIEKEEPETMTTTESVRETSEDSTTTTEADAVDKAIDSLREHVPKASKRKVNPAETDFLRHTLNSSKPMLSILRDPTTGEWREEVYTPSSFREKSERVTRTHNPMDVLKHYENREKLWTEHSKRLEARTKELESKLKRARVEAEASRRLRSRKSKRGGGQPMNPP